MFDFVPVSRVVKVAFVLLLLCRWQPAQAQGGPGSGGPTPDDAPPTAVPIDGGASLLLAAGAAYGVRRLRRR